MLSIGRVTLAEVSRCSMNSSRVEIFFVLTSVVAGRRSSATLRRPR
jgi:hypothetical protein